MHIIKPKFHNVSEAHVFLNTHASSAVNAFGISNRELYARFKNKENYFWINNKSVKSLAEIDQKTFNVINKRLMQNNISVTLANSIITTPYKELAQAEGELFVVWPLNSSSCAWSPSVSDILTLDITSDNVKYPLISPWDFAKKYNYSMNNLTSALTKSFEILVQGDCLAISLQWLQESSNQ